MAKFTTSNKIYFLVKYRLDEFQIKAAQNGCRAETNIWMFDDVLKMRESIVNKGKSIIW